MVTVIKFGSKQKRKKVFGFFHWSYLFQFSKTKKILNLIYENLNIWWPHREIKFYEIWRKNRIISGIQINGMSLVDFMLKKICSEYYAAAHKRNKNDTILN